MVDIKQPIFIVGVGRSGSTVFHEMLARHPQLCWLSRLCDKFPDKPSFNRYLMNVIDFPLVGQFVQEKITPDESYIFWNRYCTGFSTPCKDLTGKDVTQKTRNSIHKVMAQMPTKKRNRLLVKVTGWPRVGFLKEIYNDAKFIHIIRDGRAVANSLINMDWWWGYKGPQNWRWGQLTDLQNKEWEKHDQSFIALACIQWKILMDAMEKIKPTVQSNNFLEIKYEELCSNPTGVFKRVSDFCGLKQSTQFDEFVKSYPLKNINDKWKKDLSDDQKNIMEDILQSYLEKFGYSV